MNPISYLTKKTWHYSKGNRRNVVLYLGMFTIANLIEALDPLIIGWLLNTIQEEGVHAGNVWTLIGIAALLNVRQFAFWCFHGPARVIEIKNAFLVRANYKKYLLDGTMDLPAEWHADHHSGNTIDKVEKGSRALFGYSSHIYEVMETFLRFVFSYIVLLYFNLHSSYIVAFMVLMTVIIVLKYDNFLRKQYRKLFSIENQISAKIFDIISNITTVIILRLEKLASSKIFRKIMSPFALFSSNVKHNEFKWFIVSICAGLTLLFVIATYLLKNVAAGTTIMVGTLYVLYGYVKKITDLFYRFTYRYGDIMRWKASVENSEELAKDFREKPSIEQISLRKPWNELRISDLNFSYEGKDGELHLRNVDFSFKRNENIALVGESGSGKTTFLKLIRGLYTPKKVKMMLDNKPIAGFDSLESSITLVPQDPELFTTTIKENITMGLSIKQAELFKFADLAQFSSVVKRLPKGYESSIVEKGVNLSGGEKQRLALTRGLLAARQTPILLLDEPTSSVDAKNELDIYKNIFKAFKDKTIISSIHRLHLLHYFDKIYLFKKGKIVAKGPLNKLMRNKEFYALWKNYTKTEPMH